MNTHAEEAVLGSVLIDGTLFFDLLEENHFYEVWHRAIFRAMKQVKLLLLIDELQKHKEIGANQVYLHRTKQFIILQRNSKNPQFGYLFCYN